MIARIVFFGISVFTLSACSSLNALLSFQDEAEPAQIAAEVSAQPQPAAPPPAAAPPAAANDWCQRVAASERQRAQQQGFDAATLDRMALQSYRQCVELGAR